MTRSMTLRHLLAMPGLLVLLALPCTATAQGTYSVAGYSLAGARGTAMYDIDAALVNPALLGLPGRRHFSLRLVSVNTHVDQNIMSIGRWNRWMEEGFIDEDEKDSYLNSLGKAARVSANVEVGTFGLQIGRLALGTYHVVDAEARMPTDLFELLLRGNRLNRTYHFGEFGASTEGISVFYGTYAFRAPAVIDSFFRNFIGGREIYGGIGLKYYAGHQYAGIDEGTVDFTFLEDGIFGHADYRYHTAGIPGYDLDPESDDLEIIDDDEFEPVNGSGIGLDLGVAAVMNDHWTVHGALLNLSPGITWKNSTYNVHLIADADTIGMGTFLEFDEEAETTDLDSLTSYDVELERIDSFRTPVPVIFRVGTTYQLGRLALNAEFEQPFSRGLGFRAVPRLGLGMEWRPIFFLPLRAGLSFGGRHGLVGAVGLGLDFRILCLEVAVANTGITPDGIRGFGAAAGLKITF